MNCPKCNTEVHVEAEETCLGYLGFAWPFPNCDHDDNQRSFHLNCSCGFKAYWTQDNKCPACEWVGKKGTFRDTPTKEELLNHGNL